jgi:hypothetical protein
MSTIIQYSTFSEDSSPEYADWWKAHHPAAWTDCNCPLCNSSMTETELTTTGHEPSGSFRDDATFRYCMNCEWWHISRLYGNLSLR